MRIVDTHIHIWTAHDPQYPMFIPESEYPWWAGDLDQSFAEMNEAGIDKSVIVQIPYHQYDHSYPLKAINTHPARYAVTGLADLLSPQIGDELARLKQQGIQGVRLSVGPAESVAGSADRHLWIAAAELNVPILLQIGPDHLGEVTRLASDYPETRFLLDHVAAISFDHHMGEVLPILAGLAGQPNIYIKTSHLFGVGRSQKEEHNIRFALDVLRQAFGAERMMFGSNWPLVRSKGGLKRCVTDFLEAIDHFANEEKDLILWGTADRIYP